MLKVCSWWHSRVCGLAILTPCQRLTVLAALLLLRLPANASWEATEDGPRAWSPDCPLASWLFPGPVLAVVDIWGHKQADKQSVSPPSFHLSSR